MALYFLIDLNKLPIVHKLYLCKSLGVYIYIAFAGWSDLRGRGFEDVMMPSQGKHNHENCRDMYLVRDFNNTWGCLKLLGLKPTYPKDFVDVLFGESLVSGRHDELECLYSWTLGDNFVAFTSRSWCLIIDWSCLIFRPKDEGRIHKLDEIWRRTWKTNGWNPKLAVCKLIILVFSGWWFWFQPFSFWLHLS